MDTQSPFNPKSLPRDLGDCRREGNCGWRAITILMECKTTFCKTTPTNQDKRHTKVLHHRMFA